MNTEMAIKTGPCHMLEMERGKFLFLLRCRTIGIM